MNPEISSSREDYLKAIIEAESEGRPVGPGLLSHWLDVSPPAVTKALRRLRDDGFVEEAQIGLLRLTAKGREVAHSTARRHYLVERMLSEIFGMEWHEIHSEAERLEHAISPAFEEKLRQKLGEEADCPHGNRVLPESPAERDARGLLALSAAETGHLYRVESLYERDPELLPLLHRRGVGPRTILRVLGREFDQTLRLAVEEREIFLGLSAAKHIFVRPLEFVAKRPGQTTR